MWCTPLTLLPAMTQTLRARVGPASVAPKPEASSALHPDRTVQGGNQRLRKPPAGSGGWRDCDWCHSALGMRQPKLTPGGGWAEGPVWERLLAGLDAIKAAEDL